MTQKNCTVLFLQYLYQTFLYSDNFRHTYTTINLLSAVYFTFFIKSKTGNQLKFQQYSALAHCSHTVFKLLCREMSVVFIAPKCGFITSQTLMMWTTESGQCYRVRLSTACWRYLWIEAMSDWHLVKHSADGHCLIDQMIVQWRFRLRAWVRARGRQFEHLI